MRALALALAIAACHPGGEYVSNGRAGGDVDRGETNGRMFDLVSNLPEGDDWNIRLRGTALNASYGDGDKAQQLGTQNLTDKEAEKVWDLIDKIDIPSRHKGKKDTELGYVELRLREPGEDKHDIYTVYIPRDNDNVDDDVAGLLKYLDKMVKKHFKKEPNF